MFTALLDSSHCVLWTRSGITADCMTLLWANHAKYTEKLGSSWSWGRRWRATPWEKYRCVSLLSLHAEKVCLRDLCGSSIWYFTNFHKVLVAHHWFKYWLFFVSVSKLRCITFIWYFAYFAIIFVRRCDIPGVTVRKQTVPFLVDNVDFSRRLLPLKHCWLRVGRNLRLTPFRVCRFTSNFFWEKSNYFEITAAWQNASFEWKFGCVSTLEIARN